MEQWTEQQIKFLKEHHLSMSYKEISDEIGKSTAAVRNKCWRLSLRKEEEIWNDNEIQTIVNWYKEKHNQPLELDELAKKIGRTRFAICIKAKQLGLTEIGRHISDEQKEVVSKNIKKYIKENGHPKGMKGKTHTDENKRKQSANFKKRWADPNNFLNTPEATQMRSDRMMKLQATNPAMRKGYSRGKQGKRADLNDCYFRSSWEANYARHLNSLVKQKKILKWEYEVDTFWFNNIKRGTRSYLPDFKVWLNETDFEYHEIKGYMDAKSKTKLNRMRIYYPQIKVVLIDAPVYNQLKRQYAIEEHWEK